MLSFIIPLRSKKASNNWDKVVHDFNMTLKSVLNQLDPDFRVIVVCTDLPPMPDDDRIEVIQIESNYRNVWDGAPDKWKKIKAGCIRVRDYGGGYIMVVDADDLVSNRISRWVNANGKEHGFYAKTGYEYDDRAKRIIIAPKFWNLCGTCAVLNCSETDLPASQDDPDEKYTVLAGHTKWKGLFEQAGRPLTPFPFRPVVYKINTNENISLQKNNVGFKRKMLRKIFKGFPVSEKIRAEFSLHD